MHPYRPARVFYPYGPRSLGASQRLTLAFDLLSPITAAVPNPAGGNYPRCRDIAIDRQSLQGAGVDLAFTAGREIPIGNTVYLNYHIDGFELRAGWDLRPSGATAGSGWLDAANLVPTDPFDSATDEDKSGFTRRCEGFFEDWAWDLDCDVNPPPNRNVTLTGFDNQVAPYVPTDGGLVKAGVIITGETTDRNWLEGSLYDADGEPDISNNSTIKATLTTAGGTTCLAQWDKVPFWGQGLYLDLMGPCALTSAEELIGASVTVEAYVVRNGWGDGAHFGIQIDSVRLSTVTTGQYTRPQSPMVVTIGDNSSFNIFGQVSMPRNDLNVRWNGPAPVDAEGEPVAIGGGNMILSGLGSYVAPGGEAGVLCCGPTKPAERIVNLVATVPDPVGGTTEVGTARVVISDVDGPGSNVTIEEWSI